MFLNRILISLFATVSAVSNIQSNGENVKRRRAMKSRQLGDWTRIYYDRDEFDRALEKYELEVVEETFSSFLGNESAVELSVGDNDVGVFDIDIDNPDTNATTVGSIEEGGSYVGVYEKDVIEIEFENFEEGKIYAFGSTWIIDQEISDLVDDDWFTNKGSESNSESSSESDSESSSDDDDEWGEWSDGWGKMLHIRIGKQRFNLVDELYYGQTNFLGFLDPGGFNEIEIFSPKSEEAIDFTMSEVLVSVGEPVYPPSTFETLFGYMMDVLGFLISLDYSGLINFISQFLGSGGDR